MHILSRPLNVKKQESLWWKIEVIMIQKYWGSLHSYVGMEFLFPPDSVMIQRNVILCFAHQIISLVLVKLDLLHLALVIQYEKQDVL